MGTARNLKSYRGNFVLLHFWSAASTQCRQQLDSFQQHYPALSAASLVPIAVNVDDGDDLSAARSLANSERFSYPILFAPLRLPAFTTSFIAICSTAAEIFLCRCAFLLDREGMIVKVYQGAVAANHVLEDLKSIPATAAERFRKALPFEGQLIQDAFQRNDFTYGVAMFQHGYLEQAAASFLEVVADRPDKAPDAYYNLGTLRLGQKDFTQARQYLEKCLQLRPDYPEAWNNLGMLAAQSGNPEEAIRNFRNSLAQRPQYATALLNLGNVYRRQRDFENARKCFDQAIHIQPDDPEVNYSFGMLYAQQGQLEQAAGYLERAIVLRPDDAEALNNLGVLFVRAESFGQAEEQFKAGIRVAPNYDQPYLNLARLYVMQNDRQSARDILMELLRVQPDNAAAKQALGMLQ